MGQTGTPHTHSHVRHPLEHGDQEVEQQDIGEEQVQAEHRDREPLGKGRCLPRRIDLRAFGLVGVRAIGAAAFQVEIHAWSQDGKAKLCVTTQP